MCALVIQRPRHQCNIVQCNTNSQRSFRRRDLHNCENVSYDGLDMWSDQVASLKISFKAQHQGNGKGEGKIKDVRITPEGDRPRLQHQSEREQKRTIRDDRRWLLRKHPIYHSRMHNKENIFPNIQTLLFSSK